MESQKELFSGKKPQVIRQHPQVSSLGDKNKTANEPIRKLVGPQVSRPACTPFSLWITVNFGGQELPKTKRENEK